MKNMEDFDYLPYCIPCKAWCCHSENPFASKSELAELSISKIIHKKNTECVFLKGLKCKKHALRPFECRIFPFDVKEIGGELWWVLWKNCPAFSKLPAKKFVEFFEEEYPKKWGLKYVEDYIKYHKSAEPAKYSELTFKKLKILDWNISKKREKKIA